MHHDLVTVLSFSTITAAILPYSTFLHLDSPLCPLRDLLFLTLPQPTRHRQNPRLSPA